MDGSLRFGPSLTFFSSPMGTQFSVIFLFYKSVPIGDRRLCEDRPILRNLTGLQDLAPLKEKSSCSRDPIKGRSRGRFLRSQAMPTDPRESQLKMNLPTCPEDRIHFQEILVSVAFWFSLK